jgi:hypothetical protein
LASVGTWLHRRWLTVTLTADFSFICPNLGDILLRTEEFYEM